MGTELVQEGLDSLEGVVGVVVRNEFAKLGLPRVSLGDDYKTELRVDARASTEARWPLNLNESSPPVG